MKEYLRLIAKKAAAFFITVCFVLSLSGNYGNFGNYKISARTAEEINADMKAAENNASALAAENKRLEAEIGNVKGDVNQQIYFKSLVEQNIKVIQDLIDAQRTMIELQINAIEAKKADIEALEDEISDTEREIEFRLVKIKILERENELNKAKFAELVRDNYMTGNYVSMELLMSSKNFFDLVMRADMLKKAGDKNVEFMERLLDAIQEQEEIIDSLEVLQAKLDADRLFCEGEKAELELQLAKLQADMEELDNEMTEQQNKLWGYAVGIQELQSAINDMYRQFNANNEEIEEQNRITEALIKELQNLNRADYSGDGFRWPLDPQFHLVTCSFGWDAGLGRNHYGMDVGNAGINGANIYAVQSGTVIVARTGDYGGGYGSYVVVDHGGGVTTLYAHMQHYSVKVSVGQDVTKGDTLGSVGNTGYSFGAHLHFEVRVNGVAQNPANYSYTDY
ncbi:MAG: peptidoglycan DD-metalloendopeptidase family protein [Oscillospiraceae bacterium]|nr:peptidoglycan DD-metalloendopeptidase family protein [Oscillospiraceae bacterium]